MENEEMDPEPEVFVLAIVSSNRRKWLFLQEFDAFPRLPQLKSFITAWFAFTDIH